MRPRPCGDEAPLDTVAGFIAPFETEEANVAAALEEPPDASIVQILTDDQK